MCVLCVVTQQAGSISAVGPMLCRRRACCPSWQGLGDYLVMIGPKGNPYWSA